MGLRGWARGWSIGVFQFIKSGRWPTGERLAYERLGALHDAEGVGGPVTWECFGRGRSWLRGADPADNAAMARAGWEHVRALLGAQAHDLYILDEFAHVLDKGWVDPDKAARLLAGRPGVQHVDFLLVDRNERVEVEIPVTVVGDAAPSTIHIIELPHVVVSASAVSIPESIEVDITGVEAGTAIRVADLTLPKGVEAITDAEIDVVNVAAEAAVADKAPEPDADGEAAEASAE